MSEQSIEIISMVEGLSAMEDTLPKPSNKYLPNWWKQTKLIPTSVSSKTLIVGNVKNCPSFPDYFSQGFVIPMWVDSILRYEESDNQYLWRVADDRFKWSVHSQHQFIDDVDFRYQNKKGLFVFKTECPWKIITPPGYSVCQLPIFYDFDAEFSVLPGIVDTDVHHTVNQQVIVYSSNKDILIKKGTPLAQYVVFKRDDYKIAIRDANKKDLKKIKESELLISREFMGSGQYIKNRKQRQSKQSS